MAKRSIDGRMFNRIPNEYEKNRHIALELPLNWFPLYCDPVCDRLNVPGPFSKQWTIHAENYHLTMN